MPAHRVRPSIVLRGRWAKPPLQGWSIQAERPELPGTRARRDSDVACHVGQPCLPAPGCGSAGIRLHHTGIDREAFTPHQTFAHATLYNGFEHETEGITVTKATMSILREGRMVRHRIFKTQAAEPAVRQVQVNLLTQAAFRADAEAVADDQHADHQFRIDGGRPVWL